MFKSTLSIALLLLVTTTSFAATSAPIPQPNEVCTSSSPLDEMAIELKLVPLPASTLFDNALANNCGCEVEKETHAEVRINTHNLLIHDSRLVDFVNRIA